MKSLPKNFCSVPWKHIHLETDGTFRSCCRSTGYLKKPNGEPYRIQSSSIETVWKEGLNELREQFIKNERPSQCRACWSDEEAGSISMREHWNKMYKFQFGEIEFENLPEAPASMDLWLNNTCNLKCRICGPHNSSKWIEESLELHDAPLLNLPSYRERKFTGENFDLLKSWLPKIKKINFFGGEPLLGKEQTEIVQAIVQHGHPKDMELSFTTNGTIINQTLFDLWKHFKHIHLVISVDGIGERFRYQRFPGQWSSVQKLVSMIGSIEVRKITPVINFTINNYSLFYFDEIVSWIKSLGLKNWQLIANMLTDPPHLNVGILPNEVKQKIIEMLAKINLEGTPLMGFSVDAIVNYLKSQPEDNQMMKKFIEHTVKTDRYRKNSFAKTFPEYHDLLKPYFDSFYLSEQNTPKNISAPHAIPELFCPAPFTRLQLESDSKFKPCNRYSGVLKENETELLHPQTTLEQAWQSSSLKSLRNTFAKGFFPKPCLDCLSDEDCGSTSLRKQFLSQYTQDELHNMIENKSDLKPKQLDFKLSNKCNLKCRICGPVHSSSWVTELKSFEQLTNQVFHDGVINLENYHIITDWLSQIESIDVSGGEPLISPDFYKLLEICVSQSFAHKIKINCFTNATIFDAKFVNMMDKFKKVNINFSIDDIAERFSYQRNPANWEQVTDIIKRYLEFAPSNVDFTAYCTVSVFNVYYLPEYVKWIEKQPRLKVSLNILHDPNFFSIVNIPEQVKERIILRLRDAESNSNKCTEQLNNVINYLQQQGDSALFEKALTNIEKIDQYRKQNFSITFAEYWDLICENNLQTKNSIMNQRLLPGTTIIEAEDFKLKKIEKNQAQFL